MAENKGVKIFALSLLLSCFMVSCNPYKGFKGVNTKGMSNNKAPSQVLKDDYDKASKKMQRKFKKEMKKRKKKFGTPKGPKE